MTWPLRLVGPTRWPPPRGRARLARSSSGTDDEPLDKDGLIAVLEDGIDGVVAVLTERFDGDVFAAGKGRLPVVANVAVGYDSIDLDAATSAGVVICNTPRIVDDPTADVAFLLILAASCWASEAEAVLRKGQWDGFHMGGPSVVNTSTAPRSAWSATAGLPRPLPAGRRGSTRRSSITPAAPPMNPAMSPTSTSCWPAPTS